MQQGLKRRLFIYVGDGEASIEDFSGDQCRQLLSSGAKSRSQSPRKRQRDAVVSPTGDGEVNKEYVRGRRRRRSFGSSSQDPSFDGTLWTTSQETIPDTDIDDNDDELDKCDDGVERQSKRRCVASPCNDNDPSWKSILDPHP